MDLLKILDTKPIPAIVDARTLGISENTSGDYWLPTTMSLYQKELTDQIVSLHYSDILRYFETKDYKEDVILQSMKTMCMNSAYVATHPYLLIDHYMPKSLITKDIPVHLAETSGKFTALRDLINLVQEYETDTAIVCRPGSTMDLLEALLLGNKVFIKRYDDHSIKSKQKPRNFSCTCHLFPSSDLDLKKHPINTSRQFDMLISLDPTVDTDREEIQAILRYKRDSKRSESHAPIVRLVTINSIEHCELYFGKLYPKTSRDFLESVTAAVVVLRDRVGTLPPDLRPIYSQNLRYLIEWLENPSISWPLPDVYSIKKYTSMDVERSLLTEVHYSQIEDELEAAFSSGKKRGRFKGERESLKNPEMGSFYQSKRLKNDYTTNPFKQDMAQLTGISTADDASNTDYHLSSGILTHKLIQSIGQTYVDLEGQTQELLSYVNTDPIQQEHVNLLESEKIAIDEKLRASVAQERKNIKESEEVDKLNDETREAIEKIGFEIDQLLRTITSKGDKYSNLERLFSTFSNLGEKISREESLSRSKDAEKEYTEKESERAAGSLQESKKEIESCTLEFNKLQNELEQHFEATTNEREEKLQSIGNLKPLIEEEKSRYNELTSKVGEMLETLNSIQTTRVRVPNGKNNMSRRLKNSI